MGCICYYIPGANTATRERITKAGLEHILPAGAAVPEQSPTMRGPDGETGVVFAYAGRDGHTRLGEGNLEWQPMPSHDKIFFATRPDNHPAPEDLERGVDIESWPVVMADGKAWRIPVARYVGPKPTTPLKRKLTKQNGAWKPGPVVVTYRDFYERACRAWDDIFKDGMDIEEGARVTVGEGWDLAEMAIGVNYRISADEIGLLELFDSQTATRACLAVLDWPALMDILKKNQPVAEPSSLSGSED